MSIAWEIPKFIHDRLPLLGTFFGICLISFLIGCEAPHSNPFDPESPGYNAPEPPTRITNLSLDSLSATEATISWTVPNGAAYYRLYSGPEGWDGTRLVEATPYDDVPGVLPAGTTQSMNIHVIPMETRVWAMFTLSKEGLLSPLSNLLVITPPRHDRPGAMNGWARSVFQPTFSLFYIALDLSVVINDSDGVDSVWADSDIGSLGKLLLTSDNTTWQSQLQEYQLPNQNIERFIGHPILFHYRDNAGFQSAGDPVYLVRVIFDSPEIEAPANRDTVGVHPLLKWIEYDTFLLITFSVEVYFVSTNNNLTLVYSQNGIPADSTEITLETITLSQTTPEGPAGLPFYVWTVAAVDEFGDRAISREEAFEVSNGD